MKVRYLGMIEWDRRALVHPPSPCPLPMKTVGTGSTVAEGSAARPSSPSTSIAIAAPILPDELLDWELVPTALLLDPSGIRAAGGSAANLPPTMGFYPLETVPPPPTTGGRGSLKKVRVLSVRTSESVECCVARWSPPRMWVQDERSNRIPGG